MQISFVSSLVMLAAIMAPFFASCGLVSDEPSSLKDEVNPQGQDSAIKLIVHSPRTRTLPDFAGIKPRVGLWCINGPTCPSAARLLLDVRTSDLPVNSTRTDQSPLSLQSNYSSFFDYRDHVGNTLYRTRFEVGQVASRIVTIDISLQRIDVHHMQVYRPDGSTYTARGTAEIHQILGRDQDFLAATIDTGTGIDVIGNYVYKIIVSAQGDDGLKTYVSYLDFTH